MVVNLLPIPGLDGGQIVMAMIEKYRGKAISNPTKTLINNFMLKKDTFITYKSL